MKRFGLALAASVAALTVAPAANAALFIGISVNGGAISTVATDSGSGLASYAAVTGGYQYNIGASGFPSLAMPKLLTQSTNVQQQGGANAVIDVYISQTDLTSNMQGLLSSFTSNTIDGLTAQITSYYSAANAQYTGTQLQNASFTSSGTFSGTNAFSVAGPWSETVRYRLTFTGGNGSNFNGTANLAAVPEPATWGMMLLGFGAMGTVLRRRKASKLATA